jgi:hypothetical protein
MDLVGILSALVLLIWLAFRGWSVLLLTPLCALVAAAIAGEPLLAHWTQTFMGGASEFLAQFFSPVSTWGAVREADGRQRIRADDRQVHDRETWNTSGDAGRRSGRRDGYLWRR